MQLSFDMNEIEAIRRALGATEYQVHAALRRTIARVTASVKARMGKDFAQLATVQPGVFRKARLFAGNDGKSKTGVVWVGLDPISLSFMKARNKGQGVQVRQLFIPNAFVIDKIGSKGRGNPVFMRGQHTLPDNIVEDKRGSGIKGARRLAYKWAPSGETQLEAALALAEERLPIEFERELKYEIDKALK